MICVDLQVSTEKLCNRRDFSVLYTRLLVQMTGYNFHNFVDLITIFDILNVVDVLMLLCDCVCVSSPINFPSRRELLSHFKPRPILFFMNKISLNQQTRWELPLHAYSRHSTKKPVTTMLTYPSKCTVLHCNHLGNTWKPLVLMT